ncbi:MAG: exodeoxyribonuclease VII small subunit [Clostridia bacterium]|nr:exodeoxyribonuclease VII small subunit [Clostridia bacterium]
MEDKKTFEQSLSELEAVAYELEKGDLSLEKAIEKFERGIKLSKECNEKLEQAERKINILVEGENGEVKEENFISEE